ncbi:hypothetical protein BKI52_15575 [marine bacterium AO1-C]|nr:hypothetical protein BKI52_15575 [marine bacterium AO1-C]
MNSQFSLFDTLILLGIIQGIIISFLLLITKRNTQSNRFLALGLLSFCLLSTKPLLHTQLLWETHYFRYFPNALELAVAPLLFFYVKALFTPKFQFKRKYWLHFLPLFISQAYAFIVYFVTLQARDISTKKTIANHLFFDEVKQLDEYILLLATLLYLYQGFGLIKDYKHWLNNTTSDTKLPDFKWMRHLFILFSFTGLIILIGRVFAFINLFNAIWFVEYFWRFVNLYTAFLIYYLGLKGYFQPNYVFPEKPNRVKTSVLDVDQDYIENYQKIERSMVEDKLFLETQISLQKLAQHLSLPQREISNIINHHFKTNFRDFINHYRIEEVKVKLKEPSNSNKSIFGIASECGFNSETSFYRLFKKHVGVTPKKFLDQSTTH